MRQFGRAMRSIVGIGFGVALMGILCGEASSSPPKPQSYVSKKSLTHRTDRALSSPQPVYSTFLLAQRTEESVKSEAVDSTRLKDPKMAVFYAIMPGVLVHGAGHFYAGKYTTGVILVGSEVVGGSLLFIGGLSGLEKTSATMTGGLLMLAGGLLFAGSWAYDLIAAPAAVKKENEKLLEKKSVALEFQLDHEYDSMKVILIRRF